MKLISVPIAAAAAVALFFPAPAFARTGDAAPAMTADERTTQALIERGNSTPVVADPKATNRAGIGSYPTRKGVILATSDAYKGLIPTGHAAIVFEHGKVVEAVASGVKWGPNNWNTSKNQAYASTVKATSAKQDAQAATWASNQRRKPYNIQYWNVSTRSKFYCSQLVWAAFKDNFRIDLNTPAYLGAVHPLELVLDNPKVRLVYRKK